MQLTFLEDENTRSSASTWWAELLRVLEVDPGTAWLDRFGTALRQWYVKPAFPHVRTLSLFSGGGGLDIAFHDAGFDVVEMVEINPRYIETLRKNFAAKSTINCTDIHDFVPDDSLQIASSSAACITLLSFIIVLKQDVLSGATIPRRHSQHAQCATPLLCTTLTFLTAL